MRKIVAVVMPAIFLYGVCSLAATAQEAPPQTARQALMEMFFSKETGTFKKHLPEVTRAALEKSGALDKLKQYSTVTQIPNQGRFQTFETGPILLSVDDPKTNVKLEVAVDKDSLVGERDDIDLSFHSYKDGQLQRTASFMPRVTFSMKMESGIWRLSAIEITLRLPLDDPDLLKKVSDSMNSHIGPAMPPTMTVMNQPQMQMQPQPAMERRHVLGNETMTLAAVRTILTAETTYAATYPAVGYTCTLSDLDGFGGGEPNEHQAMLIGSGLAGGRQHGYNFALSECAGSPASRFQLIATPSGDAFGRRTFCADQSGAIRSSADAASCVNDGTPVQ